MAQKSSDHERWETADWECEERQVADVLVQTLGFGIGPQQVNVPDHQQIVFFVPEGAVVAGVEAAEGDYESLACGFGDGRAVESKGYLVVSRPGWASCWADHGIVWV